MTHVEIKAAKVAEACKKALPVAEDDLEQYAKTPPVKGGSWAMYYHQEGKWDRQAKIRWLKALLVAANASEGVVTMSVDDCAKIGEWM